MTDHLKGKTAIITGASRGIGEATARLFAEAGANVALLARSEDAIARIAAEIGANAMAIPCDVADWGALSGAVDAVRKRFGGLDVLVNNAGVIDPIARLEDADPAAWSAAFDINLKGVFYGLRAAIPAMKAGGGGVIVNISSGAATGALEGWSHYCSSKAAALSLTRCAAKELEGTAVRVVGLSPGTVATEMQVSIKESGVNPVSKLDWSDHIPPEWPAKAIAWLASEDAREFDGDDVSLRDPEIRRCVGLG